MKKLFKVELIDKFLDKQYVCYLLLNKEEEVYELFSNLELKVINIRVDNFYFSTKKSPFLVQVSAILTLIQRAIFIYILEKRINSFNRSCLIRANLICITNFALKLFFHSGTFPSVSYPVARFVSSNTRYRNGRL